jgi:homogentisate 1,2-dioxygenase
MTGHGPDADTFEKASRSDTSRPGKVGDTMAFMFETPVAIKPTQFALETSQLQSEYFQCWQNLANNFTTETK